MLDTATKERRMQIVRKYMDDFERHDEDAVIACLSANFSYADWIRRVTITDLSGFKEMLDTWYSILTDLKIDINQEMITEEACVIGLEVTFQTVGQLPGLELAEGPTKLVGMTIIRFDTDGKFSQVIESYDVVPCS